MAKPKKVVKTVKPVISENSKNKLSKKSSAKTPTEWDIIDKGKKKFLTFYSKEKVLAEIPVTPEILNDLMIELNNYIIIDDNIADSWTFRTTIEKGQPEFLTILNEGKILGTLPIDEQTGKKLGNKLSRYIKKPTFIQSVNNARKTTPKRFYTLAFFTTVVLGILLYGVVVNILNNFGLTIPNF